MEIIQKDAPAEETKITETPPATEVNPDGTPKETPPAPVEVKKEATVSEVLNQEPPIQQEAPKPEVRMVPEAVVIELKKDLKDLKRQLSEGNATKSEIAIDIAALAEKHNVDEEFLSEFANDIMSKSKAEFEKTIADKFKPIQDAERSKKIDEAFKTHFSKAMEGLPEYEGIVKEDVIKTLSLNPANANKTFAQIIEETYGHLTKGKATFDPKNKAARVNDGSIDTARMNSDAEYYKEVMADPVRKAKYNESLTDRIGNSL